MLTKKSPLYLRYFHTLILFYRGPLCDQFYYFSVLLSINEVFPNLLYQYKFVESQMINFVFASINSERSVIQALNIVFC